MIYGNPKELSRTDKCIDCACGVLLYLAVCLVIFAVCWGVLIAFIRGWR